MTLPSTLLDLAVLLRAERDAPTPAHIATLASRLGYRSIWMPVHGSGAGDIDALAASAPVQIGAVLHGTDEENANWLASVAAGRRQLLVSLDVPAAARQDLIAAIGGLDAWRRQVFPSEFDGEAAGCVLRAPDRDSALLAVRDAVAGGAAKGSIGVAMGVSIGRTMSEADARAQRDPAMDAEHVRAAGLFGTFEDAQEQALELAAAGAGWILADLATERDIADLLAQLRAVVAGPTTVLHANRR